jgi:hypothetical protein
MQIDRINRLDSHTLMRGQFLLLDGFIVPLCSYICIACITVNNVGECAKERTEKSVFDEVLTVYCGPSAAWWADNLVVEYNPRLAADRQQVFLSSWVFD